MATTNWAPTIGSRLRSLIRRTPYAEERGFARRWAAFSSWPPNVFAFTSLLLEESGAYRFAVSPRAPHEWPPSPGWNALIAETARAWTACAVEERACKRILELGEVLREHRKTPLSSLARGDAWDLVTALLELHATADEACAGVGIPMAESFDRFVYRANLELAEKDTLARVANGTMTVLPKLRTPQAGISIRSLSQHLSAHRSEVRVRWRHANGLCSSRDERLNLLVVPWPDRIEPTAFRPAASRLKNMDEGAFGFFDFDPGTSVDCSWLARLIDEAKTQCGIVHGVIFPEGAIAEDEIARIEKCLAERHVSMLVAGVRAPGKNFAHLGVHLEGDWDSWQQHKHHRWCIDGGQIHQYHLGPSLHPSKRWWENVEIPERELHFITANGWLTVCHLICEDLARQEPVASVVRAVGPNLVIALLLDGPQLMERWPGRYASVLADDPGSSVLTVTSLGMSLRSWSDQKPPSRVVALWKDPRRGAQPITLDRDDDALLLCLSAMWMKEWLADGRSDGGTAAQLVLSGVEPIRATPRARERTQAEAATSSPAPTTTRASAPRARTRDRSTRAARGSRA